ncbi:hypothetical protein Val02_46590 [Virgisporangium aliadipatigenens]|uniref:Protein kinase domain-containing protein n=1 Tax=Virgisporangium aliadipatigenens TaxID=741659 RepID=A0A8J4DSD9_9ACTN|nr:serine/threonine-protein kinase [Virgisporangium aliadipatigenens]GIJ47773.1 hypothetical protein Val02_46590 [Virgisporangium aliadipatigenens]
MRPAEAGDPRTVGRFRILARIGAGGMATVYFGRSPSGRPAAVKVLHAEFATDPPLRERFRAEVAAARAAGGPYSPAVLAADPDDERPWLATEYLAAVSLREAVRLGGPLPPGSARPLAVGLAEALASVHAAGVVHGDVNPANVLLTADGPRLVDFGLARLGPDAAAVPAGAPGFMAPEQALGGIVGPAGDVYGYGATLVYACAGTRVDGTAGVGDAHLRELLAQCLSREPARRPGIGDVVRRAASGAAAAPRTVHSGRFPGGGRPAGPGGAGGGRGGGRPAGPGGGGGRGGGAVPGLADRVKSGGHGTSGAPTVPFAAPAASVVVDDAGIGAAAAGTAWLAPAVIAGIERAAAEAVDPPPRGEPPVGRDAVGTGAPSDAAAGGSGGAGVVWDAAPDARVPGQAATAPENPDARVPDGAAAGPDDPGTPPRFSRRRLLLAAAGGPLLLGGGAPAAGTVRSGHDAIRVPFDGATFGTGGGRASDGGVAEVDGDGTT